MRGDDEKKWIHISCLGEDITILWKVSALACACSGLTAGGSPKPSVEGAL